jgi:hypothetical protein
MTSCGQLSLFESNGSTSRIVYLREIIVEKFYISSITNGNEIKIHAKEFCRQFNNCQFVKDGYGKIRYDKQKDKVIIVIKKAHVLVTICENLSMYMGFINKNFSKGVHTADFEYNEVNTTGYIDWDIWKTNFVHVYQMNMTKDCENEM